MSQTKITPDSTLSQILKLPQAEKIMNQYHIPCVTCPFAAQEMSFLTIKKIAEMYEIDLEGFLEKINHPFKHHTS